MPTDVGSSSATRDSVADLRTILHPRSVAVVGASDRPGRRGYQVVKRLVETGYSGTIYPVNPRGGSVLGLPMYQSLADVPGPVDVIDLATAISVMPEVLKEAPRLNARGVVIFADGFMDVGESGPELQEQVMSTAREAGIRIIGPNTMGLFCARSRFSTLGSMVVPEGPIGFISQSGNVGITAMVEAAVHGTGFTHFLGIGRQLDIGVHDCIRYLAHDDDTKVIAAYLEGIPDGQAFLEAVEEAAKTKPVVIFKAGATSTGAQAAASHSGSLASEDRVFTAACLRAGAQRVERSDELLPVALALAEQPAAPGYRVALFGSGGGHTVQTADAAERAGLCIPPLTTDLEESLGSMLPPFAGVGNPADFAGGLPENTYPITYAMAAELALASPEFDGVVMFGMYGGWQTDRYEQGYVEASERIAGLVREYNKPVVMHTIFAREPHNGIKSLHTNGIPTFHSIETSVRCFRALADRGAALRRLERSRQVEVPLNARERAARIVRDAKAEGRMSLLESEAAAVLSAYGVPVLPHRVANNPEDIPGVIEELGLPVAVKVHSSSVLHKSDSNGVILNVSTTEDAISAYHAVIQSAPDDSDAGAIIYQMASPGSIELILGIGRDPSFGPVILLGLGGIFVEAMNDVVLRLPPLLESDVSEMIAELQGRAVFDGVRGRSAVDREGLARAMVGLSQLAIDVPEIAEVDVNPFFADGSNLAAADARIILS